MRSIRMAMAQIDPTVGDLHGNGDLICTFIERARAQGADIVTFPELALTGYPPEDLLLKPQFVDRNLEELERVVDSSSGIAVVLGFVDRDADLFNSAAFIHDRELLGVYHKVHLPNYGVFDENRYFRAGSEVQIYTLRGVRLGVSICEDIWHEIGPPTAAAQAGAEVLLNISGSPYHVGKGSERFRMLRARATDNMAYVAYNNIVGGQDELVFDGHSAIIDPRGRSVLEGKQFEEDLLVADLDADEVFNARIHNPLPRSGAETVREQGWEITRIETKSGRPSDGKPGIPERSIERIGYPGEVYAALVLGTRDYVRKNGFRKVVMGLSGGIDSSLTAAIAVDALGPENVICVTMPSRYSSEGSVSDSELLARNLGIRLIEIPIERVFQAYLETLSEEFEGTQTGSAEENLQARTRGNILMALSNKFGWLVLSTGNKSEMATGYSTLYGDMCGGLAVIKDVLKTMVYELARYRNSVEDEAPIPESVVTKEPSAELKPGQRDVDALPPYEVLDPILRAYIEEDRSVEEIISRGFDEGTVHRAVSMVDRSEFKRRQSTPGIKITPRAFGRDRRMPITNRFRP